MSNEITLIHNLQYTDKVKISTRHEVKCKDDSARGRYVYIHIDDENYLSFCEVQVFGELSKYSFDCLFSVLNTGSCRLFMDNSFRLFYSN